MLGTLKIAVYTANLEVRSTIGPGPPPSKEFRRIVSFLTRTLSGSPLSLLLLDDIHILDLQRPSLSFHSKLQVLENPTRIYFFRYQCFISGSQTSQSLIFHSVTCFIIFKIYWVLSKCYWLNVYVDYTHQHFQKTKCMY